MAAHILFDFIKANQQAAALEDTAEAVKRLADRKMENTLQQLNAVWKSDSASLYQEKLRQLQQSILQTADDIEKTAQNLRYRSRKIHEAELAAIQIAANNSNGG